MGSMKDTEGPGRSQAACVLLFVAGWLAIVALGWAYVPPAQDVQPPAAPEMLRAAENLPAIPLYCRLVNVAVIDGDTLVADIVFPWGVRLCGQNVRALGYDAWESRKVRQSVGTITDAEIAKGKLATEALRELLAASPAVYIDPGPREGERDNYGRILANVHYMQDGELHDVAGWARRCGHCRE